MNDAQPLIIGGFWRYCEQYRFIDAMGGLLNELMIFNRTLSPQQIYQLYRNVVGFDPTFVGSLMEY